MKRGGSAHAPPNMSLPHMAAAGTIKASDRPQWAGLGRCSDCMMQAMRSIPVAPAALAPARVPQRLLWPGRCR